MEPAESTAPAEATKGRRRRLGQRATVADEGLLFSGLSYSQAAPTALVQPANRTAVVRAAASVATRPRAPLAALNSVAFAVVPSVVAKTPCGAAIDAGEDATTLSPPRPTEALCPAPLSPCPAGTAAVATPLDVATPATNRLSPGVVVTPSTATTVGLAEPEGDQGSSLGQPASPCSPHVPTAAITHVLWAMAQLDASSPHGGLLVALIRAAGPYLTCDTRGEPPSAGVLVAALAAAGAAIATAVARPTSDDSRDSVADVQAAFPAVTVSPNNSGEGEGDPSAPAAVDLPTGSDVREDPTPHVVSPPPSQSYLPTPLPPAALSPVVASPPIPPPQVPTTVPRRGRDVVRDDDDDDDEGNDCNAPPVAVSVVVSVSSLAVTTEAPPAVIASPDLSDGGSPLVFARSVRRPMTRGSRAIVNDCDDSDDDIVPPPPPAPPPPAPEIIDCREDSSDDDGDVGSPPRMVTHGATAGRLVVPPMTPAPPPRPPCVTASVAAPPMTPGTAASFARRRVALASSLYASLNAAVFDNRLPPDLAVLWNAHLKTTAGLTHYSRPPGGVTTAAGDGLDAPCAYIELATKVVDAPWKLQSTLAHEMCHAAAWLLDGAAKPPHGPAFRKWAARAMAAVPGLEVATCHSYDINFKVRYGCANTWCGQEYGRHSESIDVTKKACGVCGGRLALLSRLGPDGTPVAKRPPSEFAEYVRTHFATAKRDAAAGTAHGAIMKALGESWRAQKAAKASDEGVSAVVRIQQLVDDQ